MIGKRRWKGSCYVSQVAEDYWLSTQFAEKRADVRRVIYVCFVCYYMGFSKSRCELSFRQAHSCSWACSFPKPVVVLLTLERSGGNIPANLVFDTRNIVVKRGEEG